MRIEIEEDLRMALWSRDERDEAICQRLRDAGMDTEKPIRIVGINEMTRAWVFEGEPRTDQ